MTNNHCPQKPAIELPHSRELEIKLAELAELIQDKIAGACEDLSMDEMIQIDPRIIDSWTECPRCESRVCETQQKAYGYAVNTIMNYLKAEFC